MSQSEQLKFIVKELNKEPFSRSYNLISFDSLEPLQLLQVLTDVLADIDTQERSGKNLNQKVDVREESADQTAMRIFGILRILKYKPPTNSSNLSEFRKGLVQGEKPVIYPILDWLLKRIPELRKRAYLAKFLVKVDVPPDFMSEDAIADLYQQYEELLEEFKVIHKQSDTLKKSGFNTTDIKKDIASMEEEKEQLYRRVERLRKKVESMPNSEPMLAVARNLRQERDREAKIQTQKHEQKNLILQYEQRVHRMHQQLKDVRQASIGATPEGLVQRLDEENKVNAYMLNDKLPKEISATRNAVNDLQRVVAEPAMGQSDLDEINQRIKSMNAEVNQLIEKRMMSGDPTDDKLSLFRQQAAIIARKKAGAAENLREAREEFSKSEAEANEKRQMLQETGGGEVLKGDEFKRYVNKLRTKSTTFKKKRQELAELRAEAGVLSRTEEILKNRDEAVNQQLGALEAKKGVAGYRETQDALESVSALKSDLDQMKGRTLEDISVMVQKLNRKIQEKKSALAPIIKELRPLRQKAQGGKTTPKKPGPVGAKSQGEIQKKGLDDEVKTTSSAEFKSIMGSRASLKPYDLSDVLPHDTVGTNSDTAAEEQYHWRFVRTKEEQKKGLRRYAAEVQLDYDEAKSLYDTTVAGLESNRSKLEQEVRAYREECSAEESRFHYVNAMSEILELQQQRIQAEMKAYVSSDPQEKKRSFREQYTRKIQEQENLGKGLREKQKTVKDSQENNLHQMKMWKDLERILDCKLQLGSRGVGQGGALPQAGVEDGERLII